MIKKLVSRILCVMTAISLIIGSNANVCDINASVSKAADSKTGNVAAGTETASYTAGAEEQEYVGNFNLYTYRADTYLKSGTAANRTINTLVNTDFPSKIVVDLLNDNTIFQTGVEAWRGINYISSPSDMVKQPVDEKGYYTAIILSIFKAETTSDDYVLDISKTVMSSANKVLSNMKKWATESDKIELDRIKGDTKLSANEKEEVAKYLTENFKGNHPDLDDIGEAVGMVNDCLDAMDTLGEALELMESYIRISQLKSDMKSVLIAMYNMCPNSNSVLKSALYDAAVATKDFQTAILAADKGTVEKVMVDIIGDMVDESWEYLISLNPYAEAFKFGADIGNAIANTLFSTDKTIEQYEKMRCLEDIFELLKPIIGVMQTNYENQKNSKNACAYFAAIDAYASAAKLSCEFAKNYADILYNDASLGWAAVNKASYAAYNNSIDNISRYLDGMTKDLVTSYLAELETDHPEIYNVLMKVEENGAPVAVSGIQFKSKELTVGLEPNYVYFAGDLDIFPANASNTKVIYTTSDETVLSVDKNCGLLTPHKKGSAIITATSVDGGFTDTVTVTVVGEGEIWDNVSAEWIVKSGSCGENARYDLYNTGRLVIEGEGKFESSAFCGNDDIKSVEMGEGITSVVYEAFFGCSSLTSITIPESVASIEYCAFSGCSSLTSITIPAGVTSIGSRVFEECGSLTSIKVSANNAVYDSRNGCNAIIETRGNRLIYGCSETIIPDSVTSIGNYAFHYCKNLTNIIIPEGVTGIGAWAFEGCSSLTSITIPEGVTSIGYSVFYGCSSLTSITIPDSVTSIDYGAFQYCSSLTSITIPDSVTSIGNSVFYGCSSLTIIRIPKSTTEIGYTSLGYYKYNNEKIENFTIQGYANTAAQTYASENGFKFIELDEKTSDSGINMEFPKDSIENADSVSLISKQLTAADKEYQNIVIDDKLIDTDINPENVKFTAYDITLKNSAGTAVQPKGKVTVKMPVPAGYDGAKCKVYYVNDKGEFVDMKAVYTGNYMIFETTHFSTYMITDTQMKAVEEQTVIYGDANKDGSVNSKDVVMMKKHLAGYTVDIDLAACDVNGDGTVNSKDVVMVMKKLAGYDVARGK